VILETAQPFAADRACNMIAVGELVRFPADKLRTDWLQHSHNRMLAGRGVPFTKTEISWDAPLCAEDTGTAAHSFLVGNWRVRGGEQPLLPWGMSSRL